MNTRRQVSYVPYLIDEKHLGICMMGIRSFADLRRMNPTTLGKRLSFSEGEYFTFLRDFSRILDVLIYRGYENEL